MKTAAMDRSQSTSFQVVEDWLRGLGLLQYAQSFYDNGYEDVDTCKQINEEDLDVIGVKGERDRNDILIAVEHMKQNVYFELEVEPVEKPELVKYDPIILKSKLKETLKVRNIQLIEPPYYNPDGTFGDLYPLAITLADDLGTVFTDVLEALEQLRKRQLPVQTYDVMNNENAGDETEEKRKSVTLNDPAEYLNCELAGKNRGYSFSKYDTRVTKSTTDLTKDVHHERSHSAGSTSNKYRVNPPQKANSEKAKSRFSIFHRKETVKDKDKLKDKQVKEPQFDFKANDLEMSQSEICDMFSKLKKNEMSQEEVMALVKKRTGSGDRHQLAAISQEQLSGAGGPGPIHTGSLGKSKKSKINKNMIKRTPSATFYTKDDTPYILPAGETSSLERTRSGSSLTGDADSLAESSPDLKAGILSKIRSSMRKKSKMEGGDDGSHNSSLSPSASVSSQENIAASDVSGKNSPEVRRHENTAPPLPPNKPDKTEATSSHVYQHPTPILAAAAKGPLPVPPSKPRDNKRKDENSEVFADNPPSESGDLPLKIKEYTKYQDESSRRKSVDKENDSSHLPGKGMVLDLSQAKLKPTPKVPPRITKTSASSDDSHQSPLPSPKLKKAGGEDSQPTTPVAPPRSRKPLGVGKKTPGIPGTPIESIAIDDIGKKMDSLIAGLNDRLNDIDDNYVDDSQLDNIRNTTQTDPKPIELSSKKPVPGARPTPLIGKPSAPPKRPILPPRPSDTGGEKNNRPMKPPHGKLRSIADENDGSNEKDDKKTDEIIEKVTQELAKIRRESIASQHKYKAGEKSRFKALPLKRILQKKLKNENVFLHEQPYTAEDGTCHVPHALVKRYSEELSRNLNDVVKTIEEIRVEERLKTKRSLVRYNDIPSPQLPDASSLEAWLVSVGLPMFIEDLREVEVTTIEAVYQLKENDFLQIGVFQDTHVALLLALAKLQMEPSSIAFV